MEKISSGKSDAGGVAETFFFAFLGDFLNNSLIDCGTGKDFFDNFFINSRGKVGARSGRDPGRGREGNSGGSGGILKFANVNAETA